MYHISNNLPHLFSDEVKFSQILYFCAPSSRRLLLDMDDLFLKLHATAWFDPRPRNIQVIHNSIYMLFILRYLFTKSSCLQKQITVYAYIHFKL